MAEQLSLWYKGRMIPEFAREYLTNRESTYNIQDVYYISDRQIQSSRNKYNGCLQFEDTDLLTNYIWLEDKFGIRDKQIWNSLEQWRPDLYLLCSIDLPWQEDPLREDQWRRKIIAHKYIQHLERLKARFCIVEGSARQRFNRARFFIESMQIFHTFEPQGCRGAMRG